MDGSEIKNGEFEPICIANLEARLAVTEEDIDAAQALRYQIFYDEMKAVPSAEAFERGRDGDRFDAFCDHLLVIDRDRHDVNRGVVGTYRLLRRSVADLNGGFYSSSEYDISNLIALRGEILELGRSCVDADHRTRPTMQLLWTAIAAYVWQFDIEIMFGCASLPGIDPQAMRLELSYLYHYHLAPPALRVRALPELHVEMRLLSPEQIDRRKALAELPPLIKGYLRLGGFVGDGAVVDKQFNTTDVSILVKTELVTEKYMKHYQRASGRGAAT